jgi:hypothetical protein
VATGALFQVVLDGGHQERKVGPLQFQVGDLGQRLVQRAAITFVAACDGDLAGQSGQVMGGKISHAQFLLLNGRSRLSGSYPVHSNHLSGSFNR